MMDVIVVGGGACGLTAALAAAQHGARVTLIEKSFESRSNTARSSGMIPAAGTRFQKAAGVEETPEDFANDILNKNKHKSDPAITRHMTTVIPEVVEWLVDECGVTLEFVDDFTYPGHSTYRMHAPPTRTGADLHTDLLRAAEAHDNITIMDNTAVTGVKLSDDEVAVSVDNVDASLMGKKLILATNGFGANSDMVREFTPDIASAMYFGSPGNTGEGIAWGIENGAATAYMDAYQGHNSVSTQANELISYAMVTEGGFQVNKHGQRFGTEDQGYSERSLEVLAQP
ncbi:MAG: FAD-binding protein, partial [Chloroflexota bacterium]